MEMADREMSLDPEATEKAIAAIMSAVSNRILERGMKREWELIEARTLKRRQEIKNRFLAERRKNEEEQIARKLFQ